ncbi:hypothetical protein Van01_54250 [Micromonospora andamanensis]|uniref:Uncharacterized protein n=1 Tax=Micromonospora andamanensis TaxID=1287068 RepID=A0ABQ4I2U9_9ACTN|nr:hypothetical protein Van01_54250 [Micromonospora andamanensis]
MHPPLEPDELDEVAVAKRRRRASGPSRNRRNATNRWRDVVEWGALAVKVLSYAIGLAVTLAQKGCGPN